MNDPSLPPPLPPPLGDPPSPAVAEPTVLGPAGPRGWAIGVIVISVVVAMARVAMDKAAMADEAAGAGATARLEAEVAARYMVGMNTLVGSMAERTGQPRSAWLAPLEAAARSPRQHLELDILRREILGPEAADAAVSVPPLATEEDELDWQTWEVLRSRSPGDAVAPSLSAPDRSRFEDRHGWFARLAFSQGKDDGDPQRAAVLAQARRTFIGSVALMVGVVGALGVGCVLGAVAWTWFARGRGRWWFAERDRLVAAAGGSVWLEVFALYLGMMVLGGLLAEVLPAAWSPWPMGVAFLGSAALGLWWPRFRGVPKGVRRAGFGWHAGRGLWREIGAGVAGYVAGLPIIAVGVAITLGLTVATQADATHPLNHLTGVPLPVLLLLGVMAAVWAPVVEELFFRGAFFAAWRRSIGRWASAFGTGVIFAAVHPQGWAAIPALGAVGMVLALLREWRGSIVAPITAHALNNGTLFAVMLVVLR